MDTLIPAISTCVSRMTSGERRVAERLEAEAVFYVSATRAQQRFVIEVGGTSNFSL